MNLPQSMRTPQFGHHHVPAWLHAQCHKTNSTTVNYLNAFNTAMTAVD
jgi:hypothetical protein